MRLKITAQQAPLFAVGNRVALRDAYGGVCALLTVTSVFQPAKDAVAARVLQDVGGVAHRFEWYLPRALCPAVRLKSCGR